RTRGRCAARTRAARRTGAARRAMHAHRRAKEALQEPATKMTIVRAEGLTKQVETPDHVLVIVKDATFEVAAGEAVAILGASGSGKSTLLGLLARLDVPTSGRAWIDGSDLFALTEDGRAQLRGRMVGFVFQSFQLLPA